MWQRRTIGCKISLCVASVVSVALACSTPDRAAISDVGDATTPRCRFYNELLYEVWGCEGSPKDADFPGANGSSELTKWIKKKC